MPFGEFLIVHLYVGRDHLNKASNYLTAKHFQKDSFDKTATISRQGTKMYKIHPWCFLARNFSLDKQDFLMQLSNPLQPI